ncbi:Crp/Fnr family transcriptional regulator [Cytobacillus sp. S13-E01]|uniref:Crp/Fnr family transcriptional regulator n=1 Tax=Cytobacillus sp. S13-E01 TaxID=3031326 RepID=UPI0023D897A1|nr:Crp/Fnr family transcriptional regulator [Cytobacillus sp. S13-E01]MDF0727087.1 Crp/Fnr family transcriptional regulator [Cytobacillus sp. S13-E01]
MNALISKNTQEVDDNLDLSKYGNTMQIGQKQIIYSPDKPTISAFYLMKGCVKIVNIQKGTSQVVNKGQFFGDRSIFYSKNIYAEALTDVEIVVINNDNFHKMIKQDVGLAFRITKELSNMLGRNDRTTSKMDDYITKFKNKRKDNTGQVHNNECHC